MAFISDIVFIAPGFKETFCPNTERKLPVWLCDTTELLFHSFPGKVYFCPHEPSLFCVINFSLL